MGRPTVIANAANQPLYKQQGTVPDVSGAMKDWFQPMIFEQVIKTTTGYQVAETAEPFYFQGTIQPFTDRQLMLKPEGQRAWTWYTLHADPVLTLQVDEVVFYLGVQTRVMARRDYGIYGYVEYHLVQDWTGSGPEPSPVNYGVSDGGQAGTTFWPSVADGEAPDTHVWENTIDGGGP